ncbi:ATP-dependent DNA ligase [Sphingomonas crusticola]|uniref:ATP-dependent DNA ligase n=1 Tax=Sphingomonas crusticola TaxID=1697973 RepID=UPI001F071A1D|nr:ATP-dependent DNA ligase [Sphingomonas crusticola]
MSLVIDIRTRAAGTCIHGCGSNPMAQPKPSIAPMEARLVDILPQGPGWIYEPKWDGFRCIAYRHGEAVTLVSKSGKPLGRYFPEVIAMLETLDERYFILDGELTIATGDSLSFAALQARLHPAESRIRKLSMETPAQFILFDCLSLGSRDLGGLPFAERRAALESFCAGTRLERLLLSPATTDARQAESWLARAGTALDGVVAKRLDLAYQPGVRAMAKLKQHRTADCVVGGFRYAGDTRKAVGSLLLGLFDDGGRLNHVGFTSSFDAAEKKRLLEVVEPLIGPPGFTGDAPGGPSRWSTDRSVEWQPLRHELVVEVRYDQVTGCRFRHGTTFLRWRPDKAAEQCRMDQLARELKPAELEELLGL